MNGTSSRPNYQFGVELEVFLEFKNVYQNGAEDGTMKGKWEELADHIVQFYDNAVSPLLGRRSNCPRMVRLTPSQMNHSPRWEYANPWKIKDEPSTCMVLNNLAVVSDSNLKPHFIDTAF